MCLSMSSLSLKLSMGLSLGPCAQCLKGLGNNILTYHTAHVQVLMLNSYGLGMRDAQMQKLIQILKNPQCRIFALNLGILSSAITNMGQIPHINPCM